MNNAELAVSIKNMCKAQGISVSTVLDACGIRKSFIYDLEKRDSAPSIAIIESIADYFECSVDFLLGRYAKGSIETNLTQNELELLEMFRKFDDREQLKILGRMTEWAAPKISQSHGIQVARRSDGQISKQPVADVDIRKIDALPDDTSF